MRVDLREGEAAHVAQGSGLGSRLALTSALSLLAAASVAVATLAPDEHNGSVRVILLTLCGALAVGSVVAAALEVRRRRLLRRLGDESLLGLPSWANSLTPHQFDELATLVRSLEMRTRAATRSAGQSRRRSTQSLSSVWQVLASAVSAEERVRGRFVADLHDSIVQRMILCAYLAEDPDTDRETLSENIRAAEQELREIMVFTRPPELRRGTLGRATASLAGALRLRHNLDVSWTWPRHESELPEAVAITVYRFFQEALTNVAKHAGVQQAHAGLSIGTEIVAWVRDNGDGFDPAAQAEHPLTGQHVGLELMSDRAQQIGARVEVETAPGDGTVLTLTLPLPPTDIDRPVQVGQVTLVSVVP